MIHGPLAKKIFLFAVPLALSSMLQQLFNAADLAVVGQFASPNAMAAVGSNASVISLLVSLFTGLALGANVIVGNLIGAGKKEEIHDAVHTSITVALISGLFLLIVGILIARPILTLMGAPKEVIDLATLYLRIYFCGMPAMMLYNFGSAVLRSKGDSTRPFLALTFAGVINILLNLLFVVVFHLHVIGVGLATVLSNCISGGLVLYFLLTEEDQFRLVLKDLHINMHLLKKIIMIGIPAGMQGMLFSISNVVIQAAVNSFGADCIAGMTAAQYFDFLSFCLMSSFAQTCTTFVSQNFGAGDLERCGRVRRISLGMGLGLDVIFVATIVLLKDYLILLFTRDPAVIEYAMIKVNYAFVFHFLVGTYEITGGALRGMNKSMVPTLISLIGTCAVRLVYVLTIFPFIRTPAALVIVYPLTWTITGTAMNIAYYIIMSKWRKRNVLT